MTQEFKPEYMQMSVLTAALQELTPRDKRRQDPDLAVEDWIRFGREPRRAAASSSPPRCRRSWRTCRRRPCSIRWPIT